MIRAALEKHEKAFFDFVRNWIRLLSNGNYDEAIKQIDSTNSYGFEWSEATIKKVIEEYIGEGKQYSITDPYELEGDGRPNLIMINL